MRYLNCFAAITLLTLAFANGCSRGGREVQQPLVVDEQVEAGSVSQYESQLRDMVGRRIAQIESSKDADKSRVLYRKPYFYKEYSTYTESSQTAEVSVRETDSRARPYEGKVEVDKIRYATRMHRNRADASIDDSFVRQTGTEVLHFELRNGRWNRVGSIFAVDTAEELVNGQWVTVQEERAEELMQEPEMERGFFGNLWGTISGR